MRYTDNPPREKRPKGYNIYLLAKFFRKSTELLGALSLALGVLLLLGGVGLIFYSIADTFFNNGIIGAVVAVFIMLSVIGGTWSDKYIGSHWSLTQWDRINKEKNEVHR